MCNTSQSGVLSLDGSPRTRVPALSASRKAVAFNDIPTVHNIEKPRRRKLQQCSNMAEQIFQKFEGSELTDSMLAEAAQLFNQNYGIWGHDPTLDATARKPRPGSRVKLSKERLRAQCLVDDAACSYVRVTIGGRLAGNAFACRWEYNGDVVCWVTQLVVHSDFRERGLAASLLLQLRQAGDSVYGLMSSHPAACLAAAKAFGSGINGLTTSFIRDHAAAILQSSPISYVKDAELRGSLFNVEDDTGAISSVLTRFYVDHVEPLEALDWVKEALDWPLGELLEGHEFLLMISVRHRDRSRSSSRSASASASASVLA